MRSEGLGALLGSFVRSVPFVVYFPVEVFFFLLFECECEGSFEQVGNDVVTPRIAN